MILVEVRILGSTPFLLVRFAASLDDWGRRPDIWITYALGAAFAYPISGASNLPSTHMVSTCVSMCESTHHLVDAVASSYTENLLAI